MIIINSGDYVNIELRNEVGTIPPCFLPLANKKLLYYQIENLRKYFNEQIVVSLPQNYDLSLEEKSLFKKLSITPIFVPEGIQLGSALLFVLNTIDIYDKSVIRLLHGDTLLLSFPEEQDVIGLANPIEDYISWEKEHSTVWCGYFSFSSLRCLIRNLAIMQGNFVDSVRSYNSEHKLKLTYCSDWFDFGHVNTYFKSRALTTTQRNFNVLKITDGIVWKSGENRDKIRAEWTWYKNIPPCLKRYTPQLINIGDKEDEVFYELEYLPYLPLNELFVHCKKSDSFWKNILTLIKKFMDVSRAFLSEERRSSDIYNKILSDSRYLYVNKTYERINIYKNETNINLDGVNVYTGTVLPSINQIVDECIENVIRQPTFPCIMHGDLCFSNILYDSRLNIIKLIDPRGLIANQSITIYGDQKYDLAKLCHSFIGLYDFIIADSFEIIESEDIGIELLFGCKNQINNLQKIFLDTEIIDGFDNVDSIPLVILLFLSMLPLHADKPLRQKAMFANALRLYRDFMYK